MLTAAIYCRKSTDQGDRDESVRSVGVQRELAEQFIKKQGWVVGPVFEDDGISGAVFAQRPGLQALLAAVKTGAFQVVVIESQSRLGRDTLKTALTLVDIEKVGVEVWSIADAKRITLKDADSRLMMLIKSEIDAREREKTSPLVRSRAHQRHEQGFVVGGRVYGYRNVKTCGGCVKDGVGTCRHPSVRKIDEAQASAVHRIFTMAADGLGLGKIRAKLNAEGVPGPRGAWSPTGVREVLNRRDYIGDVIVNRIQRARDDDGNEIRIEQPESEWKVRKDETLRIVSDEMWQAAHDRIAQTKRAYLTRGNQLVGQVESTKGLYLLSGFLVCGYGDEEKCGAPLIVVRRGRNLTPVYICRDHREKLNCGNTTGVPMHALHAAVVGSLDEALSPESFERHLQALASDSAAREQRAAERTNLLAEIPKLAAVEQRLVRRIATIEDDALVAALKEEWSAAKALREQAERRLQELEGIERASRPTAMRSRPCGPRGPRGPSRSATPRRRRQAACRRRPSSRPGRS
jgi:DNA invertase Pin-like site-specific DNA recombinase